MACSSCVEFEQQDLWFRYDEKADTLRMFTVYGGLFNGADLDYPSEYLDEAMREWFSHGGTGRITQPPGSNAVLRYQLPNAADAEDGSLAQLLLDNVSIRNGSSSSTRRANCAITSSSKSRMPRSW